MELVFGDLKFSGVHAHILQDTSPEIIVEGARMCAKTYDCCAKVRNLCIDYPGIWTLICRFSGTETANQLRPIFSDICRRMGPPFPVWDGEESAYLFPEKNGHVSKVFAYGLKSQSRDERYAKIRGSGVSILFNDQHEEMPEDIATEMRALLRQPGYPHQLILAANPFPEDSFIADQFPEDADLPGRKRYALSLYDNAHNLQAKDIEQLERTYPPTHARYKSLILGQRGVNIVGTAIYEGAFIREKHLVNFEYDKTRPLLECIQSGQHHPSWLIGQRNYWGGLDILGALIGKWMYLDQFLPLVRQFRSAWFEPDAIIKTCCDTPPEIGRQRHTNIEAMKDAGFHPTYKLNGTAPDVRESLIQDIFAALRKEGRYGIRILSDPTRFRMASKLIVKNHGFVVDGFESAYVWDANLVSVGNKKVRQPRETEWINGAQRCVENIWLNFCDEKMSDYEKDRKKNLSPTRAAKPRRSRWG